MHSRLKSRWLTLDAKAALLRNIERKMLEPRGGPVGGSARIDDDVRPWLPKLNRIGGVATLQSCQGHRCKSSLDGRRYYMPAVLWLWLSEDAAVGFQEMMPRLVAEMVRSELYEFAGVIFQPDGSEIFAVDWKGEGHRAGNFAWGAEIILKHLRRCDDGDLTFADFCRGGLWRVARGRREEEATMPGP